jgi:hypothetical protein
LAILCLRLRLLPTDLALAAGLEEEPAVELAVMVEAQDADQARAVVAVGTFIRPGMA